MRGQYGLAKDEAKGAQYLGKACDGDWQDACVELGLLERRGGLPKATPRDGLNRLVRACDRFSARGCFQAGVQLRDSIGVRADLPGSVGYFKRSCEQNGSGETDPANAGEGCGALGYAYEWAMGVPKNPSRAASFYRRGCDMGSAYACTGLGLLTVSTALGRPDTAKAAALYQQACNLKQAPGCANYARVLIRGWTGRRPDSAEGRRLLEGACSDDFPAGCRWLAETHLRGVGARPDTAAALTLYQRACDQRDWVSCVDLGLAWDNGRGVRRDEHKAFALYSRACDGGNTYGCNNLAVLLRGGPLDVQDVARANQLFEKMCAQENYLSCANLGYSYEFGRGVALDEARALEFYRKACDKEEAYGCTQLRRLSADSTLATRGTPVGPGETIPDAKRGLWALVVGLSRYGNSEIRPLAYARKDAETFAAFLKSPGGGGFPAEQVQLLVDEQATATAMRRGLHSFLRRANQGDLVLIYFAGHGRQPGAEGGIPYFLTYDTDPREMAATAVPMDELRRAVQQSITARYIVAFIDACHSGGVTLSTRGTADNDLINRYLKELSRSKETVVTFAASQENQESLEGPEYGGGHGAFTWHLMQALAGDADRLSEGGDESGTVTLRELAEYVTRKVKTTTRNLQEPSVSYLKWDPSLVLSVLRPR
jgi:hypothetical protein